MSDLPDWTRAVLLQGKNAAGEITTILVGDDGQMFALLAGEDAEGVIRTVKVDDLGQLYTVLRGARDVDVSVDEDGFLSAILKGIDDAKEIQTVRVDDTGQIIMVPRGQTGYYMSVDATGFLSAILKGVDGGATLRTVLVDDAGRMIMIPRGESGYYMNVDASGFLSAILKGVDGGSTLHTVLVDDTGQIIMVPRGSSGYYMDVDADGYITAVLKGERSGTLTTIGVDENGRLEAFLLDAESQWGDVVRTGNAELAARAGSIRRWDWRGSTIWQTDFSRGLGNGLKYPTGTGAAITIDPVYWETGGYSLKLVGGSDGNHKAYVDFLVETPASLAVGLEGNFSYPGDFEFFKLEVRAYVGGKVYIAAVRFNESTNYVQYLNSGNVWTNIQNPFYLTGAELFHRMKLVADFSTAKYKRVLWGRTETDLSAQSLYQSGTGYLSSLYVEVELNSRSGNNDVAYLDSLILTTSEPD